MENPDSLSEFALPADTCNRARPGKCVWSGILLPLLAAVALAAVPRWVSAQVNEDSAVALAKKGNCFKCHAIEKRKKAPSYREIAAKHKGKPDSEREVLLHITGNPVVQLDDGDEKHEAPPTKNEGELKNLVRWILSR